MNVSEEMKAANIGIDRIEIYNLHVVDIRDKRLLDEHPCVESYGSEKYLLTRPSRRNCQWIQGRCIRGDSMFNEFRFWAKRRGKTDYLQQYGMLNFSATHLYGINLDNMTISDVKFYLFQIVRYLEDEYGIVVDASDAKIRYLEINRTFEIDAPFKNYERPIKVIMSNLPKRLKVVGAYGRGNRNLNYGTYRKGNNSMEFEIYDKKTELLERKKFDMGSNHMRVEIKLKTAEKVKSALGSNTLKAITDDKIHTYFFRECEKIVRKPIEKWKQNNRKEITEKVITYQKKSKTHWLSEFLMSCLNEEVHTGVPKLLDIGTLCNIIESGETLSTHKSRVICSIEGYRELCSAFFDEGEARLQRILDSIFEGKEDAGRNVDWQGEQREETAEKVEYSDENLREIDSIRTDSSKKSNAYVYELFETFLE